MLGRQKSQDVVVEQRQVRGDHEGEVLPVLVVHPRRFADDPADQLEVEQRLAALELDLQVRRRGAEGESSARRAVSSLMS